MVSHELLRDEGILIIRPAGSLEASDFQNIAQEIGPYIEANGKLHGVMIDAESWMEGFRGPCGTFEIREEPPSEHRKNCGSKRQWFSRYCPKDCEPLCTS